MKRTLDQLNEYFVDIAQEKRNAAIKQVLDEQIRPHVLNVDHWHIDDMNMIECDPILIDKPEGCGERYQVYNQAWDIMARELVVSNRGQDGYEVSSSGSSWKIVPKIYHRPAQNGKNTKRKSNLKDNNSAKVIYEKIWELHGAEFREIVQRESQRLMEFVANVDNWDTDKRTSKPFYWNDPLKYTRYASHREIERIARLQLETDRFTLEFCSGGINCIQFKLVPIRKPNSSPGISLPPDEDDSEI